MPFRTDHDDAPIMETPPPSFDLGALIARVWAGRWFVLVTPILFVVIAMIILRFIPYVYTAKLDVTAADSAPTSSGAPRGLGGLASLAGLSTSGSAGASPFELYMFALTSRDVASRLSVEPRIMRTIFASEWDSASRRWAPVPEGAIGRTKRSVKALLGLPNYPWQRPDAERLREYLERSVRINRDPKNPITRLEFDHPDGEFAAWLLGRLNAEADDSVRQRALRRARQNANHLTSKLALSQLAEHRSALADMLAEQERSVMLASSSAPYAAMTLDVPTASPYPTSPQPAKLLGLSAVVGLLAGLALALINWRALRAPFPAPTTD